MSEDGYSLLVSFHDQSESYCLGFEAGALWRDLEFGKEIVARHQHTSNLPTLHQIAAQFGKKLIVDPTGMEEWCEITAVSEPEAGQREKMRLRLVGRKPIHGLSYRNELFTPTLNEDEQ